MADSLAGQRKAKRSGTPCRLGVILKKLTGADLKALTDALTKEEFPSAGIARALVQEGHEVSPYTVARHRRKECTCA